MSEETAKAAAIRAGLRIDIAEGLAQINELAFSIKNARAELAGERSGVFDPDICYDLPFARALADLAHYAYVAVRLCPIEEA